LDLENKKPEIYQEYFESTENFVLLDSEPYTATNDYACSHNGENKKYIQKFGGKNVEKIDRSAAFGRGFEIFCDGAKMDGIVSKLYPMMGFDVAILNIQFLLTEN
jgi:hypothetical protein